MLLLILAWLMRECIDRTFMPWLAASTALLLVVVFTVAAELLFAAEF